MSCCFLTVPYSKPDVRPWYYLIDWEPPLPYRIVNYLVKINAIKTGAVFVVVFERVPCYALVFYQTFTRVGVPVKGEAGYGVALCRKACSKVRAMVWGTSPAAILVGSAEACGNAGLAAEGAG
jgi:hypothetical protein